MSYLKRNGKRQAEHQGRQLVSGRALSVLACLLVAAMLTLGAGSAFATTSNWDINGVQVGKATTIASAGTVKFTQEFGLPWGEGKSTSATVECQSAGNQVAGLSGTGEVSSLALSGCKIVASTNTFCTTTTAIKVEALHLPWSARLSAVEGKIRQVFSEDGKGTPGFLLVCKENIDFQCVGNTSAAAKTIAGGVDVTFDSHSEKGTCNNDGGTLAFEGTQLLANPAGGTLAVGAEVGEWLIKGGLIEKATSVSSKGTLKFSYTIGSALGGGSITSECSSAGKGTVGLGGGGETTSLTLTGCKVVASTSTLCAVSAAAEVLAKHLPWQTVLVGPEGATRQLIAKGEIPQLTVSCNKWTFQCHGDTSAAVKAVTGGVDETFDSHSEKSTCEGGAQVGSIEGTQLVESPASGTLSFEAGLL